MKKLLLFNLLFGVNFIWANAQQVKNEAKVNLLGLVIGLPDVSYEQLLNDKMGIGLSLGMGLKNGKHYQNHYRYVVLPYYRYCFGNRYACGFLAEGYAGLSRQLNVNENLQQKSLNLYPKIGISIGKRL